jgi:hypothetical protein
MVRPIQLDVSDTPIHNSGESGRVTFTDWYNDDFNELHIAVSGLGVSLRSGCFGFELFYGQDEASAIRYDYLAGTEAAPAPIFLFQVEWPGIAKHFAGVVANEVIDAPYIRAEVSLLYADVDAGTISKDRVGLVGTSIM